MALRAPYLCLWYNQTAEDAAQRYMSVLPDSRIVSVDRAPADNPSTSEGKVLTVTMDLMGTRLMMLNGGDVFKQSEAASLVVECETQDEIDALWDGLIAGGGAESQCGWLKDPWGVSWQITPRMLIDIMSSGDQPVARAVFEEMMTMRKIDIARLEAAATRARSSA